MAKRSRFGMVVVVAIALGVAAGAVLAVVVATRQNDRDAVAKLETAPLPVITTDAARDAVDAVDAAQKTLDQGSAVVRATATEKPESLATEPRKVAAVPSGPAPNKRAVPASAGSARESKRAAAEALNDRAKDALKHNDVDGALRDFLAAHQLINDPRYAFNVALALEVLERFDESMQWLELARNAGPAPQLRQKIDHRIDLIRQHK